MLRRAGVPAVVLLAGIGLLALTQRHRRAEDGRNELSTASAGGTASQGRDLSAELESALIDLREARDPREAAACLERLRQRIHGKDGMLAARQIAGFLATGKDAPTLLPFQVGSGGMLSSAPTLRVFLLQWLPGLDPDLAVEVAGSVIGEARCPDEYALAMRNLAWCDMGGNLRAELGRSFGEMTRNAAWSASPTAGYLEALDTAVFLANRAAFEDVQRLASGAGAGLPLTQACFVAMDRMVEADPSLLGAGHEGLSGLGPDRRASLLSRLDPLVAGQGESLLAYLDDPAVGEGELAYFSELFPNGNQLRGARLVSAEGPAMSIRERAEADQRILAWVGSARETSDGESRRGRVLAAVAARLSAAVAEGRR
jgi:hypothetical protein